MKRRDGAVRTGRVRGAASPCQLALPAPTVLLRPEKSSGGSPSREFTFPLCQPRIWREGLQKSGELLRPALKLWEGGLKDEPPHRHTQGHPFPISLPPGALHFSPCAASIHPPLSPPLVPPNKEAGGNGVVRGGCLWRCPSPRLNPAASKAAGRERARGQGRLPGSAAPPAPAGQGQSRRPAAARAESHVKERRGLRGCQELRGWRRGEVTMTWQRDEAPHPRLGVLLPGADPKKIAQIKKERCVRK